MNPYHYWPMSITIIALYGASAVAFIVHGVFRLVDYCRRRRGR